MPDYRAALTGSIKGLRVGLIRHWYAKDAAPEVTKAVDAAMTQLSELGAIVEEIELEPLLDYVDCKTTISISELYAIHEKDLKTRPQDFGKLLRTRVIAGGLVRAEDYVQAMRWRTELSTKMLAQFKRFDVLATAGWLRCRCRSAASRSTKQRCCAWVMPISARPNGTCASRLCSELPLSGGHAMKKAPATREEIAVLAKNAGLDLAPEYFDELVEAYAKIEPMLMRVRRGRNRADEPAHAFDPRKFMSREA